MFGNKTPLGGALIISGTSIGGGMLALPILTGIGGVIPAILIYCFSWIFMTASGLLLAEACLKRKEDVNLITLTGEQLGFVGKALCWCVYLILFYALVVSYLSVGKTLLPDSLQVLPDALKMFLFLMVLTPFIFWGARAVDGINRVFMLGMILSYLGFIVLGTPYIKAENWQRIDFSAAMIAFPVSLLSFGYQGVVPSLVRYYEWNKQKVRQSIVLGTMITLVIYIIWGSILLGVIPLKGEHSLTELFQRGGSVVEPLSLLIGRGWASFMGASFAFFALVTSFLGVSLGLRDFLMDGFKLKRTVKNRLFAVILSVLPPFCIAVLDPTIFLKALHYGGGIGGSILLGILPVLVVFKDKRNDPNYPKIAPFGKAFMIILLAIFVMNIILNIQAKFGF